MQAWGKVLAVRLGGAAPPQKVFSLCLYAVFEYAGCIYRENKGV